MIPRTIFSIENQMQVIPRRETWEKKKKKKETNKEKNKKANEILIFFISFHVLLVFLISVHFFSFLISFHLFFFFSHVFSCPFIFSHFVSFPFIFSHVFSFCVFFSLGKTITKLDLLQFDTLFSFADKERWIGWHVKRDQRKSCWKCEGVEEAADGHVSHFISPSNMEGKPRRVRWVITWAILGRVMASFSRWKALFQAGDSWYPDAWCQDYFLVNT